MLVPRPAAGRVFESRRRIRLSDTDATGRLRLDAVARYLQDVATDDVEDNGSGSPDDLWIVRRATIEIVAPFVGDAAVELATWCSGLAAAAAARRTSVAGDAGGRIEAETIWIHLDRDGRPARHSARFVATYADASCGRRASTRLGLPDPPAGVAREPWPLRATDIDVMGHVNNAAYWEAVEHVVDLAVAPVRVVLEYRRPIDLGDTVELARDGRALWLLVGGDVRAAAALV